MTFVRTTIDLLPQQTLGSGHALSVLRFGPESAERKIHLQAALHADEMPGALMLHELARRLAELDAADRLRWQIQLVPLANPIGLGQYVSGYYPIGRFHLPSFENFNRGFPDVTPLIVERAKDRLSADETSNVHGIRALMREALAAKQPRTEIEALRLTLLQLAFDADWVLDLHCDGESVPHLYTGTDLWPDFEPLARLIGSQANLLAWHSGCTPFDEALSRPWFELRTQLAGTFPVPLACRAATIELRGQSDVAYDVSQGDSDAMIAFMTIIGAIQGPVPKPPLLLYPATPLEACELIIAPRSGVIVHRASVGSSLRAGEGVSDIVDPVNGKTATLQTRHGGLLFARSRNRFAHAGAEVAKIAGAVAHRTGQLLSM
jgi:predicted deacylase